MGSESKPSTNFGAEDGTFRELMMLLRSSFQQKDFDKAEHFLMTREENMRRNLSEMAAGIENWKKQHDLMEKKHRELALTKLEVECEFNKCRIDRDQLQEEMTRFKEEHKVQCDRSQRSEENYAKLSNEFRKVESDKRDLIFQLKVRTTDFECSIAEKRRAQGEAEILKSKFREIELRVLRLEEDISVMVKDEPLFQTMLDGKSGRERPVSDQKMETKENSENGTSQNEIGSHKLTNLPNKERAPSCHEKVHKLAGAVSACDSLETENKCPQTSGPHSINRDCDNGMPIRKQLVFEVDSTNKLMGSSMPREVNKRHEARDIIEINDSDDEILSVYETAGDANIHPSGVILNVKEPTSQKVVKSEDSGDTCEENRKSILAANHKRKRCNSSENEKSGDGRTSNGNRKTKQLLDVYDHNSSTVNDSPATPGSCDVAVATVVPPKEIIATGQNSTKNVLTESSSSDSDSSSRDEECLSSYMDEIVAKITGRNANRETWASEADMLSALSRDAELCMNAVCALYRQQNCTKKSMNSYLLPRRTGFKQFDALRGNMFAKFLIDGDPQGKLKKSVSELQKHHPKGLEDCKNLAMQHSEELFEIYQKKEDPFFPSMEKNCDMMKSLIPEAAQI